MFHVFYNLHHRLSSFIPVELVEGDDPLGLLALAVCEHEALVAHARRVHQRRRHAEDARDVLLVGVDHVRLAHTRHLELGVAHVQHLQSNCTE